MNTVTQDDRNWYQFTRHRNALDKSSIFHERHRTRQPRSGEYVVRHQTTKSKNPEIRDLALEYLGKNEPQNPHHHQRVQQGPEDTERHVSVANPEIFQDQILHHKQVISGPAM